MSNVNQFKWPQPNNQGWMCETMGLPNEKVGLDTIFETFGLAGESWPRIGTPPFGPIEVSQRTNRPFAEDEGRADPIADHGDLDFLFPAIAPAALESRADDPPRCLFLAAGEHSAAQKVQVPNMVVHSLPYPSNLEPRCAQPFCKNAVKISVICPEKSEERLGRLRAAPRNRAGSCVDGRSVHCRFTRSRSVPLWKGPSNSG
jgi:hypothetical protein